MDTECLHDYSAFALVQQSSHIHPFHAEDVQGMERQAAPISAASQQNDAPRPIEVGNYRTCSHAFIVPVLCVFMLF